MLDLRLATFAEVGLSPASSDREVWRRVQELGMLLLTDNRSRSGAGSLEQTILEEYTPTSLPVLTVGRAQRLLLDQAYRNACAERVATIIVDIDTYRGVPRLFVP